MLINLDKRIESLLRSWVVWMEEWLSIPQSWIERTLIAFYVFCFNASNHSSIRTVAGDAIMSVVIFSLMWLMHRRPVAARSAPEWMRKSRPLWGASILAIALPGPILFPRQWEHYALLVGQLCYITFHYLTSFHGGGERGRRRKMALAELAKLFGPNLGWLPRPALSEE